VFFTNRTKRSRYRIDFTSSFRKDKEILISKSNFETREMIHFLLTDNTRIAKNEYNIPEPVDGIEVPSQKIEVVFVPLLAYDKRESCGIWQARLLRYILSDCNANVIKIGLSF
jgi:5-formyltetrahydrofolate cyclo-ligase